MHSMSTGIDGFPGHWMVLFCSISLGKDMLGLIGIDYRSSRRSSSDFPVTCVVLRMVF